MFFWLKREDFLSLNGKWDFKVIGKKGVAFSGEIRVPFPPESRISGVGKSFKKDFLKGFYEINGMDFVFK